MHRTAIWNACIAGFVGTPYKQTIGVELDCAPVHGFRVTQPQQCDDYFVADCAPDRAMALIRAVPAAPICYITVCADDERDIPTYQLLGATHAYSELVMAVDVRHCADVEPRYAVQRANSDDIATWNALDPEGDTWLNGVDVAAAELGHYAIFCAD
ncbi:MAG: hypothetical protein ACKO83_14920, partial [Roseiflexaceae bacterium]